MYPKYELTSLCDQNGGVQGVDRHTDKRTDRHTDIQKMKKTEQPKIMYIDIVCYLQTVIIGVEMTEVIGLSMA